MITIIKEQEIEGELSDSTIGDALWNISWSSDDITVYFIEK